MNITELENKWQSLKPEKRAGFRSLHISSDCIPELYIGIDISGVRSLILKIPPSYTIDFKSVVKQNLSIEFFRDTHWIILKLTNTVYADLFNDLILSLYNKIKSESAVNKYIEKFIEAFYKWSEFFDDNNSNLLTEEAIKGIIGEVLYLNHTIMQKDPVLVNDVLQAWQGLYDTGHDFIFNDENIEVKTKEQDSIDIRISSEYQLESEPGKPLRLVVVNIKKDNGGITLKEAILLTKKSVVNRLGDFTIILKALAKKGLTQANLSEYDYFRCIPIDYFVYECTHESFPKLINSQISNLINTVHYNIRIRELDDYIIDKQKLNGN